MPASKPFAIAATDILAGKGAVPIDVALAALASTAGLAALAKKIGLWPKLAPVQQTEVVELDKDMPVGWWHATTNLVLGRRDDPSEPPAAEAIASTMFLGKSVEWEKGEWAVGTSDEGNLLVTTPEWDEETRQLVR
jgi:hypothetical protein